MRTVSHIKIHAPLISWLFVGLDIILLAYQVFRFYHIHTERKNWFPILCLLLLLIWNCTIGYRTELLLRVFINTAALIVAVLLMLVPFFYRKSVTQLPDAPEVLENSEEPSDSFMDNCRKNNLTPRETEIVILIRKGYKNRRIADELHISEKTVESHLQHIYDKVGERSKLALITRLNQ